MCDVFSYENWELVQSVEFVGLWKCRAIWEFKTIFEMHYEKWNDIQKKNRHCTLRSVVTIFKDGNHSVCEGDDGENIGPLMGSKCVCFRRTIYKGN